MDTAPIAIGHEIRRVDGDSPGIIGYRLFVLLAAGIRVASIIVGKSMLLIAPEDAIIIGNGVFVIFKESIRVAPVIVRGYFIGI